MIRTYRWLSLWLALFSLFFVAARPSHAAKQTDKTGQARILIESLGCRACHRLTDSGGGLAPELDQIGSRMTQEQIKKQLRAPRVKKSAGFMPSYETTSKAELDLLSGYLYNLQ